MKQNKIITLNCIGKNENNQTDYDINRAKTQADSLIRQMKEKLNNCYDNTLVMLDNMDTKFEESIENNNLVKKNQNNDKIYFDREFDKILYNIREWRM